LINEFFRKENYDFFILAKKKIKYRGATVYYPTKLGTSFIPKTKVKKEHFIPVNSKDGIN